MYQVIKLTVHESVEAALQKAFPKPAAAAKRALAKYISVVESMLFDALQRGQTPEQRKLGLYAISLDQLANKGGQIGPKKIRVHKWLTDNDWDIVQTVVKGTKFSGQNSQVKLTPLVTIQNDLQIPAASLSAATTDEEIDAYPQPPTPIQKQVPPIEPMTNGYDERDKDELVIHSRAQHPFKNISQIKSALSGQKRGF